MKTRSQKSKKSRVTPQKKSNNPELFRQTKTYNILQVQETTITTVALIVYLFFLISQGWIPVIINSNSLLLIFLKLYLIKTSY